jgi:acyl-ACP thioesterase
MYQFQSKIRYSELDSHGELTMLALLNYFQDCSIFHSEDLNLGVEYLKERHLVWVLSSWQIVIKRFPGLCENVTIGTAPYEFKGFIGYRNFWMLDENGAEIAVANSIWSLLDTESGKPVRVDKELAESYGIESKRDMEYAERHIRFTGDGKPQEPIIVMEHHLDTNLHVNNGQYVQIAMDYLPEDFQIRQLRAEYKMQAVLGTKMYPVLFDEQDKIGISLQNEEGAVYCNLEFCVN